MGLDQSKSQKQIDEERLLFTKTGNAIYNDDIRLFLKDRVADWFEHPQDYRDMQCQPAFVEEYKSWIASSRLNKIFGLGSFAAEHVTVGVTQAIDLFHYKILSENRRLRVFRGEYPYGRDVHPFDWNFGFLDDFPLAPQDAVILSCPFSGTGDAHPRQQEILEASARLNVPVFLDMAWFGTCSGLDIDLSHPAIAEVGFSVTKALTCGNYRVGMRLSKNRLDDRIALQNQWNHGVHLNTRIGLELLRTFSADSHYQTFVQIQKEICKDHGLIPSACVHIARGEGPQWLEFSRDGIANRVNLREVVKKRWRPSHRSVRWTQKEL